LGLNRVKNKTKKFKIKLDNVKQKTTIDYMNNSNGKAKKMKHYLIWASGFAYCVDEYATSKAQARLQFLKRWDLTRMPNGALIAEA
jgi:hypothetical protein